jgi:transposase IS200 family protein
MTKVLMTAAALILLSVSAHAGFKASPNYHPPDSVQLVCVPPLLKELDPVVRRRASRLDIASMAREKRNCVGQHFWARGYFVSTVGQDEVVIREYIQKQEQEDLRLDQMTGGSNTMRPRQRPS